jgi:DNA ligase (NAD+)
MNPLAGRWCVFSGRLACMSREAAHDAIEALGGFPGERITSGMTPANAVLIVGERPGAKLAKARALGVPVLDEWAFIRLLPSIEGELPPQSLAPAPLRLSPF